MRSTLFLNPPSFEGFDGGAGARYQARREIRSFWYPTWLAQPAALVPTSRLVDAPARGLSLDDVLPMAKDHELIVLYTSTPSFPSDVRVAEALREANPKATIGFVGPHVAVSPEDSLRASTAIDFVAGNEFDLTIKEVAEGRPFADVDGLSYRVNGAIHHNRARAILEDMDQLPHVVDVYRRDLVIEDYFIGYLRHPYLSVYTGRGCKSRCTFCLWPQTIGGHRYRTRSVEHVVAEIAKAQEYFPQIKEYFFDDDTLTDDLPRIVELARGLAKLGVTWSCNAKANGLRLLLVGYEAGNQQILHNSKKGMRVDWARRFSADCHKLGITIHGAFMIGLPGETRETIKETIQFAKDVNLHTLQVSLAAAYPGTYLYDQAEREGWLVRPDSSGPLVGDHGLQVSSLNYPDLSQQEMFEAVADFYKQFYFRPRKIFDIVSEMATDYDMLKRRLREGQEFFRFLRTRNADAA